LLSAGQRKGQRGEQGLPQLAIATDGGSLSQSRAIGQPHGKLLRHQFVKFQPLPCRQARLGQLAGAVFRRRRMQQLHGIGKACRPSRAITGSGKVSGSGKALSSWRISLRSMGWVTPFTVG
jgi:hypothetical protein